MSTLVKRTINLEEDTLDLVLNQETHSPTLKKGSKIIRNARLSPMQKGQSKPKALYKVASVPELCALPIVPIAEL